ncbi:uncharacterized protein PG998_013354 [Apiospora kogelbergensis]|uniref:uncharacterized protein n=1 Tax=Apiospora kogelbergensis TaxID=1337665 RepID=UPI00312CD484
MLHKEERHQQHQAGEAPGVHAEVGGHGTCDERQATPKTPRGEDFAQDQRGKAGLWHDAILVQHGGQEMQRGHHRVKAPLSREDDRESLEGEEEKP